MRLLPLLFVSLLAGCGRCGSQTAAPEGTPSAPPPEHATVRIVVGGDSRDDKAHVIPWAFQEAKARGALAFLFLGDMELTPEIDKAFARELALLDPVPFYPVLGNHEVEQLGMLPIERGAAEKAMARRFLGMARTPVRSSLPGRIVYSVDLPGGVHFIALDNVTQPGFGRDQLAWLGSDLARAHGDPATRHILVGMHKPLAHNGVTFRSASEWKSIARARPAPVATKSWTRSVSRSKISTRSASGGPRAKTARPSMPPACCWMDRK